MAGARGRPEPPREGSDSLTAQVWTHCSSHSPSPSDRRTEGTHSGLRGRRRGLHLQHDFLRKDEARAATLKVYIIRPSRRDVTEKEGKLSSVSEGAGGRKRGTGSCEHGPGDPAES